MPLALHSSAVKSQGPEQEQIRAVFVPVWLGLSPARAQGLLWDLPEFCEQEVWELLGICYCCSLLLYWSAEHIINSPYQCIVCRHGSPQAVAIRINLAVFLPFFPSFLLQLSCELQENTEPFLGADVPGGVWYSSPPFFRDPWICALQFWQWFSHSCPPAAALGSACNPRGMVLGTGFLLSCFNCSEINKSWSPVSLGWSTPSALCRAGEWIAALVPLGVFEVVSLDSCFQHAKDLARGLLAVLHNFWHGNSVSVQCLLLPAQSSRISLLI